MPYCTDERPDCTGTLTDQALRYPPPLKISKLRQGVADAIKASQMEERENKPPRSTSANRGQGARAQENKAAMVCQTHTQTHRWCSGSFFWMVWTDCAKRSCECLRTQIRKPFGLAVLKKRTGIRKSICRKRTQPSMLR